MSDAAREYIPHGYHQTNLDGARFVGKAGVEALVELVIGAEDLAARRNRCTVDFTHDRASFCWRGELFEDTESSRLQGVIRVYDSGRVFITDKAGSFIVSDAARKLGWLS